MTHLKTDGRWSLKGTGKKKEINPFGEHQPLYGGSAYMVASREFIEWVLFNSTVQGRASEAVRSTVVGAYNSSYVSQ